MSIAFIFIIADVLNKYFNKEVMFVSEFYVGGKDRSSKLLVMNLVQRLGTLETIISYKGRNWMSETAGKS